jgi:exodeoxyribonuclease-3
MRIISFNANGIRSAIRKGFYHWLQEQDADLICIQETKLKTQEHTDLASIIPSGYVAEFEDAEKRGYSGVAIFAKKAPVSIKRQLGFEESDREGRFIQFDYPKFSVISLYLPSGSSGDGRQSVKMDFLAKFESFLAQEIQGSKPLIICGDWNIAHQAIDLKNWKTNQKTSGFLPEERAWMDMVFGQIGFVDAFRVLYPDETGHYTWWSMRQRSARAENVGWRIDYQVVSPSLVAKITQAKIVKDPFFSDHAPLIIDYQGLDFD